MRQQGLDPLVRSDAPDAVHRMRIACRRLRSLLATYRSLFDREVTVPLREELKWYAALLGEARDAEVMRDRLAHRIAEQPPELVLGDTVERTVAELTAAYVTAHGRVVKAMRGARYRRLVGTLHALADQRDWKEMLTRPQPSCSPTALAANGNVCAVGQGASTTRRPRVSGTSRSTTCARPPSDSDTRPRWHGWSPGTPPQSWRWQPSASRRCSATARTGSWPRKRCAASRLVGTGTVASGSVGCMHRSSSARQPLTRRTSGRGRESPGGVCIASSRSAVSGASLSRPCGCSSRSHLPTRS